MTLRGSGSRDSRAFIQALDRLGIDRGESVGVSQSSFGGAAVAEHLPDALRIYADLLQRARLPEEQLAAGKLVCEQEIRAIEDDPGQKLMIELRRAHYPDPYGRPSHGSMESLAAISVQDVRDFYQTAYRPNGTIVGIRGQI